MTGNALSGGLPPAADLMLAEAPSPPFDWVREGTSFWLFEENGAFGIARNGVEAEPWSWNNRRFQSNFAFADGRVLRSAGVGPMLPVFDAEGRPAVLGGGPLTYRYIEPFARWLVSFDGMVIDTSVDAQIAMTVDESCLVPLRYQFELEMRVPPNVQDITPGNFAKWGKGTQRDAVSVGLGLRFEQLLRGEGVVEVDGRKIAAKVSGSRVKRRSIRTDGLFLRGHVWQAVMFQDGSAAGYEARPRHDDGFEPWNEGFVYQGGRIYPAKATKIPWLEKIVARSDDVSFELESELGITHIEGITQLSTFQLSQGHLWGLKLSQSGARYSWNGMTAYGIVERSSWSAQTT